MTMIHSIILGITEGLTEFLPVSSTFHLIWMSRLLMLPQSDFVKLFEVAIQGGAILAVIMLFWREVVTDQELLKKLMLSFIPTAAVGFVLYTIIKGVFFDSIFFTTSVFIVVGVLFLIIEYLIRHQILFPTKSIAALTYAGALGIGLFQSLAVIPGISRAGAVLVGMMILGYDRSESAKYSFMLAVPTVLMASAYDLYKMRDMLTMQSNTITLLLVGSLVAGVFGLLSVRWLVGYLQHHSLAVFGWYRIILGIILLLLLV